MKLIIQIPCYNEEETLGVVLGSLPRQVEGVDDVEWLVVDDGSTDRTVEVAMRHGVDHVVRLPRNRGLAKAFMAGLDACIERGADIIVNLDGDNQYCVADIPKIVAPILDGTADLVIGSRPIEEIKHFSAARKFFQRLGSAVVRLVSNTGVQDAPSGFRAVRREAAMRLKVFDTYTYTIDTLIQAGSKGIAVASVPVRTNENLRPSRLVRSMPHYIMRSFLTIIRMFMTYQPFRFFAVPGAVSFGIGMLLGLRFLYFFLIGEGKGHIQSVVLAALLLGTGFLLVVTGLVADLISVNRRLLEDLDWRIRKMEDQSLSSRGGREHHLREP